jgi:hypothetical protein
MGTLRSLPCALDFFIVKNERLCFGIVTCPPLSRLLGLRIFDTYGREYTPIMYAIRRSPSCTLFCRRYISFDWDLATPVVSLPEVKRAGTAVLSHILGKNDHLHWAGDRHDRPLLTGSSTVISHCVRNHGTHLGTIFERNNEELF